MNAILIFQRYTTLRKIICHNKFTEIICDVGYTTPLQFKAIEFCMYDIINAGEGEDRNELGENKLSVTRITVMHNVTLLIRFETHFDTCFVFHKQSIVSGANLYTAYYS